MELQKQTGSGSSRGCWTVGLIGCGVLLIGVCAFGGLGGYLAYQWGLRKAQEFAQPFEERGYKRVMAQVINIDSPVNEKHVYLAQVVKVNAPINEDVAFAAQVVEINATITGDVDFFGQVLTIKPNGRITGDVRSKLAQVVQVNGVVEGEITGTWQTLENKSPAKLKTQRDDDASLPVDETSEVQDSPATDDIEQEGENANEAADAADDEMGSPDEGS